MSLSSSADGAPGLGTPLTDASGREASGPRSVLPSASPVFVAVCMVVIAASLAMLLYLRAGLTLAEAGWIGLAVLLIMVLAEFFSARSRERAAVEYELQEMVRLSAGLDRNTAMLGERVADIEATLTVRIEDMIAERVEDLEAEIRQQDARIAELTETVAAFRHNGRIEPRSAEPDGLDASAGLDLGDFDDLDDLDLDLGAGEEPAGELFPGMSDAEASAMIQRAVVERGPEILLQSVVTLPQRRVRFYEALSRLRDDEGALITPERFVPLAERTGIMPIVDNAVLFRSVQIMRKMAAKHRDNGVFCNISTMSLSDSEFFQQFIEFMGDNRNLSGSIVFEFMQAAFNELGPVELANLEALKDLGFRFSLDNVTRLDLDCSTLADRGVRYIKIDANTLIQPSQSAGANIHAADLAALLARYGIELIATRIETEAQVVDILDYDVKFGQGNLFSTPRPVRADMLRQPAAGEKAS